jgi:subtilase family serine protease
MRSYKFQVLLEMPSLAKLLAVLLVSAMSAQISLAQAPLKDRISQPIDSSQMSVLHGNVHPMARAQYDQGPVEPSFQIERITIVFQRTAAQQAELDRLLDEQQDPSSPNYHKWLTPPEYADRFGVTQSDVAKIAGWLTAQGFAVVETPSSRNSITFSGTAAQVQSAFHTVIHRYVANGKSFFANAGEPSVPGALAGMILGFRGLSNFPVKARGIMKRETTTAVQPNFTSSVSGNNYLTPGDFATIYDLNPLYSTSPALDGTGQKIAVMGQSKIVLSDIATFRSLSGLPANPPQLLLIPGSSDPGIVDGDVQESSLDVEWAGAVAKNATIIFVYANAATGNGVFDALQYAIENDVAPVISISYGACENLWTTSSVAALVSLAQLANSKGITILAASGDGGAADCDGDSGAFPATQGLSVDVPASLPYVTGMGGTEFNEGNGKYWMQKGSTDIVTSALSYIPEVAWNDTSSTIGLDATGGGPSKLFAKPVWQTGTGVPNDNARDVPDVSLNASPNHDGYLICTQIHPTTGAPLTSGCVNGFRYTDSTLTVFGGTSFGPPTFAGIVALINQRTNSNGQGNVNYVLYPLAASKPGSFHDIIGGANGFSGNEVPCAEGTTDCPNGGNIGYPAGTGYDLATGLGSVDGFMLIVNWSSVPIPGRLSVSPPIQTVNVGGSATYQVTNSTNLTFSLTCSTPGVGIACGGVTVNPNSTASLVISTTPRTFSSGTPLPTPPDSGLRQLLMIMATGLDLCALFAPRRRIRTTVPVALLVGMLVLFAGGCGGSSGTSSNPNATPAGTYNITVTGTSGSVKQTTSVVLQVN